MEESTGTPRWTDEVRDRDKYLKLVDRLQVGRVIGPTRESDSSVTGDVRALEAAIMFADLAARLAIADNPTSAGYISTSVVLLAGSFEDSEDKQVGLVDALAAAIFGGVRASRHIDGDHVKYRACGITAAGLHVSIIAGPLTPNADEVAAIRAQQREATADRLWPNVTGESS